MVVGGGDVQWLWGEEMSSVLLRRRLQCPLVMGGGCPLDMGGDVQCSWKEMSSDHGRRCPVVMGGGGVQCSWEEEMSMYGGHGRGKMSSGEEKMSMSGGHVRGRCPLVMGADVQWS